MSSAPGAGRLPTIDALRAVAALSIVGYHLAFVLGGLDGDTAGSWLAQLQFGVPLFFAISGFLLYRPWVVAKLAGGPPPATGAYALRRLLRIVPAYWVALVLIALVLGRDGVFAWPGGLVYFSLGQAYDPDRLTGGIGQAWTLTVEVAFYVALPFIALLAARLRGIRGELLLLGGLVIVSLLWRVATLAVFDQDDAPYFPLLVALPAELDFFAAGMALAVAGAAGVGDRVPAWAAWTAAAASFTVLALWTPGPVAAVLAGHELQLVIAFGLLVPATVGLRRGGALRGALAWPPLAWIGLISYGIYLWHLDVLRELADSGAPGVVVGVAGVAITIALGAASWYGIERRAIRLSHRAAPRRGAARASGVAERPPA